MTTLWTLFLFTCVVTASIFPSCWYVDMDIINIPLKHFLHIKVLIIFPSLYLLAVVSRYPNATSLLSLYVKYFNLFSTNSDFSLMFLSGKQRERVREWGTRWWSFAGYGSWKRLLQRRNWGFRQTWYKSSSNGWIVNFVVHCKGGTLCC